MVTNSDFAHFLLKFLPSDRSDLSSLYNYIKFHSSLAEEFGYESLQSFVDARLSLKQDQRSLLQESLGEALFNFPQKDLLDINSEDIDYLCNREIIKLENPRDIVGALNKSQKGNIFHINKYQYIKSKVTKNGISFYLYNNLFIINKGSLDPIYSWTRLHYDSSKKIQRDAFHTIQIDESTICRFNFLEGTAISTKGSKFSPIKTFEDHQLFLDTMKINIKSIEMSFFGPKDEFNNGLSTVL